MTMTSNELEQRLRAYVPKADERIQQYDLAPHIREVLPNVIVTGGPTIPDPSPAAALARVIVHGVPATECDVCPNEWWYLGDEPMVRTDQRNKRAVMEGDYSRAKPEHHPKECDCGGTGRIGGTRGLSGLLVPCEGCRNGIAHGACDTCPDWPPVQRIGSVCGLAGCEGTIQAAACEECHGTGTVLLGLVREALDAGEELAVVGMFRQRLEEAGFLTEEVRSPTRLEALLDALDQACGVGVAA